AALFESYSVGYLQADTKRARLWLQLSKATLGRLRGHELMRAWVVNNEGLLDEAEGRYEEALSTSKRAAELQAKLLGGEPPDVATSLGNESNMLAKLGRVNEALEIGERAIRIQEKALGAEHPDVAVNLVNRSEQLNLAKRFDEAEIVGRRATSILERELG